MTENLDWFYKRNNQLNEAASTPSTTNTAAKVGPSPEEATKLVADRMKHFGFFDNEDLAANVAASARWNGNELIFDPLGKKQKLDDYLKQSVQQHPALAPLDSLARVEGTITKAHETRDFTQLGSSIKARVAYVQKFGRDDFAQLQAETLKRARGQGE